jgi:hypothetical protein
MGISISVQIPSTATLRQQYVGQQQRRPAAQYQIQNARSDPGGSKAKPLIIVRGCPALELRVTGAPPNTQLRWSVGAQAGPPHGPHPPQLQYQQGDLNTLHCDAQGLYVVSVIPENEIAAGAALYILFVSPTLSFDETTPQNGVDVDLATKNRLGFSATFKFKAAIKGASSGLKVGVIQNVTMGPTTGHVLCGLFAGLQRQGNGELLEGAPLAESPFVDCGDEHEIPFYNNSGIKQIGFSGFAVNFDDTPGLPVPPVFIPREPNFCLHNDPKQIKLRAGQEGFLVTGARGTNDFRAALVVFSKHCPHTYVVLGWIDWRLTLATTVLVQFNESTDLLELRAEGASGTQGTSCLGTTILATPLEASLAGIETYGPTAVGDDENDADYSRYQWIKGVGRASTVQSAVRGAGHGMPLGRGSTTENPVRGLGHGTPIDRKLR